MKAAAVPDLILTHPVRSSFLLLAAALAAYLPVEALVGPWHWFSLGPFAVQESRVGLYALFFAAGALIGAAGIHHRLFTRDGPFARGSVGCAALATAAFGLLVMMQLAKLRELMPWAESLWQVLDPMLFIPCCVLSSLAVAGLFMRYVMRTHRWMDRMAGDACGTHLVHYVFLTWSQTALLQRPWGAVTKAATVFVTVLASSWALTALLRLSPTIRRAL